MAATSAAQWLTTADGTRHEIIELSSDSSDDELAAGGSCGTLAPLDPTAAQVVGDANEDGVWGRESGVLYSGSFVFTISAGAVDFLRKIWLKRGRERCTLGFLRFLALRSRKYFVRAGKHV